LKFLIYHDDVCVHFMNMRLDVHGVNVVQAVPGEGRNMGIVGGLRVHPDSGSFGPTRKDASPSLPLKTPNPFAHDCS
jgi:hypothetical protein